MKGYYLMYRGLYILTRERQSVDEVVETVHTKWDEEQVKTANQTEESPLLQIVAPKLKSFVSTIPTKF